MAPLPGRFLTSLMVRYQGNGILIDCGEGTQVAIRKAGLGFKQIGVILLTHFHADHVAGIPGLLLTIGNSGRTEPLTIIGPLHTGRIIDSLRVIAPQLPFEIRYGEIRENGAVCRLEDLSIAAHRVHHWVACYAYRLDLARQPRFDPEKAKALNLPVRLWSLLQRGESVEHEGKTIPPSAVMGAPRRGLRLCYTTDLRPDDTVANFAAGSDLFICEGMYGDPAELDRAIEHRHCLFTEAADLAAKAAVGELWLTHFSPALPNPEDYLHHATAIFPRTRVDGKQITLRFPEE
jgi:ribonuclease Z